MARCKEKKYVRLDQLFERLNAKVRGVGYNQLIEQFGIEKPRIVSWPKNRMASNVTLAAPESEFP